MISAFSWQNSVSLCPASFCTPRPNLPVTPCMSWLITFTFQSAIWKGYLFLVLVLEDLGGLHRMVWLFSFFGISGWGIDLDYCDVEWFALEMNWDHFVAFEIAPKYCISDSCWLWGLLHFFYNVFLPTVVDLMVIWIKFTHSHPF